MPIDFNLKFYIYVKVSVILIVDNKKTTVTIKCRTALKMSLICVQV